MSNNKQETAVDWLLNEWPILNSELPQWLIEQAKEMEKEQIEQAFYEGNHNSVDYFNVDDFRIKDYEQYYNETYGANK